MPVSTVNAEWDITGEDRALKDNKKTRAQLTQYIPPKVSAISSVLTQRAITQPD